MIEGIVTSNPAVSSHKEADFVHIRRRGLCEIPETPGIFFFACASSCYNSGMNQIESIVFGLDGTLLNHFKDVSPANRDILVQMAERGIPIGLASGRSLDYMEKHLKLWGLEDVVSYLVGSNGDSYLNLKTGRRVENKTLTLNDIRSLQRSINKLSCSAGAFDGGKLYFGSRTIFSEMYSLVAWKKPVYSKMDTLAGKTFDKFLIVGPKTTLNHLQRKFSSKNLRLIPVGNHSLEAVNKSTNKLWGMLEACRDFGFGLENVLSFGNDWNDLELLAGTQGVAMKNASGPVRECAKTCTKYTASQDGIAYHLNSMMLENPKQFTDNRPKEKSEEEELSSL